MDCGRYLQTDSCSLEKERFDFARVLVSTTSLDIISLVDKLLIDGILVEVKTAEEWGFSIGEDACLFEDDDDVVNDQPDSEDIHADPDVSKNVDTLIGKIVEELQSTELNEDLDLTMPVISKDKGAHVSDSSLGSHKGAAMPSACPMGKVGDNVDDVHIHMGAHTTRDVPLTTGLRRKRTDSCPPGVGRSSVSGPWSMEWLRDQVHGNAGIVSSSRKKGKKVYVSKVSKHREVASTSRRTKVGGMLRHNVHSLKKVARLASKDREAVLHVLKRRVGKRNVKGGVTRSVEVFSKSVSDGISSASSVNNDWKNWVVLRGNEEVEMEDVRGMGKAIGLNFKEENHNRFSVLSRVGKEKRKSIIQKGEVGERLLAEEV